MTVSADVENAIVIFDEAHNIEDVAREAASLEASLTELEEAHAAFGRVVQYHNDVRTGPCVHAPLHNVCGAVIQWLERQQVLTQSQGAYSERIWQGPALLGELKAMGLTADAVDGLWEAYLAAREEDEASRNSRPSRGKQEESSGGQMDDAQEQGSARVPVLLRVGAAALGFVSRLIQIIRMLHEVSDDGGRDYRLVFRRLQNFPRQPGSPRNLKRNKRYRSQHNVNDDDNSAASSISLSLWCLNPSIAFRQISVPAHSILLTSGTLAPLDSFASELGATFPIRLEAPHVVNMQTQVWAGVVGQGVPGTGAPLVATYQHADGHVFQDSLGLVVLEMCRCIPDGVLLFMPSYGMMEKVTMRWKSTGLWLRLGQCKSQIVVEPRTGGADALGEAMGTYYGAISGGGGALLIAVCRGKVSEGLDFTDQNARGVLLVGIPFPNIKDSKVEAKRKYNDSLSSVRCRSSPGRGANVAVPHLLPGSLWYEQQAFRALNQAIGRCIRHKDDWGAIVLVDDRFRQPRYQKGLSRW